MYLEKCKQFIILWKQTLENIIYELFRIFILLVVLIYMQFALRDERMWLNLINYTKCNYVHPF